MGDLAILYRKKGEFKGEDGRAFRRIGPALFGRELFVERNMGRIERALFKEATVHSSELGSHIDVPSKIERYDSVTQEHLRSLYEKVDGIYYTAYRNVADLLYNRPLERIKQRIKRFDSLNADMGLTGNFGVTGFCIVMIGY